MHSTIFLILILGSLHVSAQYNNLKTPVDFLQRIIERSIEMPEDTTSVFVFSIFKTADTLLVKTIFNSSKNDSVLQKLHLGGLVKEIPDGFTCIAPVYCYRLFDKQLYPKQPEKAILDNAAAVIEKHGQSQTVIKPIVVVAYSPNHKPDINSGIIGSAK